VLFGELNADCTINGMNWSSGNALFMSRSRVQTAEQEKHNDDIKQGTDNLAVIHK
jgi:pSer/pThr/pTyr-binding forkhead associated (FHA) protein